MFDHSTELAPDLDWLLQSNQAPPDVILEGLVTEFYPAVYALAVSILDNKQAARSLAADIFARALIERHAYRPTLGARAWLFRIVLEAGTGARKRLQARQTLRSSLISPASSKELGDSQPASALDAAVWLAVDELDDATRDLALLYYLHDWKPAELEKLLDAENDRLQSGLERSRQAARAEMQAFGVSIPAGTSAAELDALIGASLKRRWPRSSFTPDQLEALARRISRSALVKSGRTRKAVAALEVAVILLVIIFAAALFWGADRWFPEPTPTPAPGFSFSDQPVGGVTVNQPPAVSPQETPAWERRSQPPHVHIRPGDNWEDLAAAMGVDAVEIKQFNRVPEGAPAEPGTRLLNPTEWLVQDAGAPTIPILPVSERRRDLLIALTGPLSYETIFFDAISIDFGPDAYFGPPSVERVQAWLGSGASLVLTGSIEVELPELVWLRQAQNEDSFTSASTRPTEDSPWFWPWGRVTRVGGRALRQIPEVFSALLARGDLAAADHLEIRGRGEWAGVEALIVDQLTATGQVVGTFWLDDRTGVILRRMVFSDDGERLHRVIQVRRLEYNHPIPSDLATTRIPWRGGYAQNAAGLPENPAEARQAIKTEVAVIQSSLPDALEEPSESMLGLLPGSDPGKVGDRIRPPADFTPAQARLTFHFPDRGSKTDPFSTADLLADGFFLAQIPFGNPFSVICDRSRDGLWFAFGSETDPYRGNILRWLNIEKPTATMRTQAARGTVTDLAFSPDSRRLAYFETFFRRVDGLLKILDLETGSVARLMSLTSARSLVWSPDGAQLAMIADLEGGLVSEQVLVMDLEENRVQTLSEPIEDLATDKKDWPVAEWGVEFPVERLGLDACAEPPQDP